MWILEYFVLCYCDWDEKKVNDYVKEESNGQGRSDWLLERRLKRWYKCNYSS